MQLQVCRLKYFMHSRYLVLYINKFYEEKRLSEDSLSYLLSFEVLNSR